jgi:type II restriction/modification system DNA methylase subunit YeeA
MRGASDTWVIDFSEKAVEEAIQYEAPFQYARDKVLPIRARDRAKRTREKWWLFERDRLAFRHKLKGLIRFMATPVVAKHRVFVWLDKRVSVANLCDAIARDDDTTFGILHSRFHEAWSLRLGTWLGVGNDPRYTPTTTFETFPFPEGLTPNIPAATYAADPRAIRIARAAKNSTTSAAIGSIRRTSFASSRKSRRATPIAFSRKRGRGQKTQGAHAHKSL